MDNAKASQQFKEYLQLIPGYYDMEVDQREALEMICHKMSRIVYGDPNYADSWVDIAGYAKLVSDRLEHDEQKQRYQEREAQLTEGSQQSTAARRQLVQ
jgi:hypothetical protein